MRFPVRSLLSVLPCLAVACSGGDFQLGAGDPAGGDAGASDDTAAVVDGATGSDAAVDEDGGGTSEASVPPADADTADSRPAETTPPCDTTAPATACDADGNYASEFNHYGGPGWLGPRIDGETSHAISYVTSRAGRHEKLILRVRRVATGTGTHAGHLTLAAYRTPCPGVHVPLGKAVVRPAADGADEQEIPFYFTAPETYLPTFPAGTRLTFVLSTDSTAYTFELAGNPMGGGAAPGGLQWFVKKGLGPWTTPSSAVPNASPWIRGCSGG